MQQLPAQFEDRAIRRVYDEERETWWFSVIDIIQVLTGQADYQTARKYWNKLKERLGKEGSESVTKCHRLKLRAADGKNYLTDVATAETLLRLVQSVPSPKAEPIKLWLAKVGYERMQELADPARALDRARETWEKHGRSEKWIAQRMMGQETRAKLTDYWASHEVKPGHEFAILTNLIHEEWSGLGVKEHKQLKGLKAQNLRDHAGQRRRRQQGGGQDRWLDCAQGTAGSGGEDRSAGRVGRKLSAAVNGWAPEGHQQVTGHSVPRGCGARSTDRSRRAG